MSDEHAKLHENVAVEEEGKKKAICEALHWQGLSKIYENSAQPNYKHLRKKRFPSRKLSVLLHFTGVSNSSSK